jgi:hypothetical protein
LRKQIKTTAKADAALVRVLANLRESNRVRWKGGRATQEAVYNAIWLWLEDLNPETIESAMAVYVPRLEAIMRGEPLPEMQRTEPARERRNAGIDFSALSLRATQRPKPKKDGPARTSGPSDHPEAPDRPSLDDKPPMYGATNLPLRSGKRKGRRGA